MLHGERRPDDFGEIADNGVDRLTDNRFDKPESAHEIAAFLDFPDAAGSGLCFTRQNDEAMVDLRAVSGSLDDGSSR